MSYFETGNFGEAISCYRKSLSLETHPDVLVMLADVLCNCPENKFRDSVLAVSNAKRAIRLRTTPVAKDYYVLSQAFVENNDFKNAKRFQKKAIQLFKNDKAMQQKLQVLLRKIQEAEKAKK